MYKINLFKKEKVCCIHTQGIKLKFVQLLSDAGMSYKIPIQISRAVNYVIMLIAELRKLMRKQF